MENKVILVGGNHHNGLGLARAFGRNGIPVDIVVVDNCTKSFLEKSRYVRSVKCFSDERSAFDYIFNTYGTEVVRPFLIPYSDRAALELDFRLDLFQDRFFVPSLAQEQGAIGKMMDKMAQYRFAEEHGIKMAKTMVLKLSEAENHLDEEIGYPCILKPVVSAQGDKKDITVCNHPGELKKSLQLLRSRGYSEILVQEYLRIDYEIDVFGCVCKSSPVVTLIPTETLRSWPPKGGTNSFSYIITDPIIVNKCRNIVSKLHKIQFYGLYDMELFVIGDDVYLNEINFRNSGDVYMALNQAYYYPLIWVRDVLGETNTEIPDHPLKDGYAMTECADIRHVVFGGYSLCAWLRDLRKCHDFALFSVRDILPAIVRYVEYFVKLIKSERP